MEFVDLSLDLPPLKDGDINVWNEAYVTVESYFFALGLRNRLTLNRCIHLVLQRSVQILSSSSLPYTPTEVVMSEAMKLVASWFQRVLDVKLPEHRLAARGRLALFLGGMETRWQQYFLSEPPWPEGFVEAMRKGYLTAGPAFQAQTMTPRPIELNSFVNSASEAWFGLNRVPNMKFFINGAIIALILFLVYSLIFN